MARIESMLTKGHTMGSLDAVLQLQREAIFCGGLYQHGPSPVFQGGADKSKRVVAVTEEGDGYTALHFLTKEEHNSTIAAACLEVARSPTHLGGTAVQPVHRQYTPRLVIPRPIEVDAEKVREDV